MSTKLKETHCHLAFNPIETKLETFWDWKKLCKHSVRMHAQEKFIIKDGIDFINEYRELEYVSERKNNRQTSIISYHAIVV